MWRTRAVERMLLEDIAGLARANVTPEEETAGTRQAELEAARRGAWRAVVVDWVAIVALLALRFGEAPILSLGPGIETIFAIGVLLVATHSGFRLGQLEKLRSVDLLLSELGERKE